MDDNSHRHRLETSPLTVGFMGVMGGVMLVAICHVIAILLFCRSGGVGQQQTTQTTAADDDSIIAHVVDGQEHAEADDELSVAANNASTNIQVIVDGNKSTTLTKYYPACKESDTCAVCLGEFKDGRGQVVRVLPQCGHVFHVQCIDMWLFNHRNCPLCRANALLPPNHSSSRGGTAQQTPEISISGP